MVRCYTLLIVFLNQTLRLPKGVVVKYICAGVGLYELYGGFSLMALFPLYALPHPDDAPLHVHSAGQILLRRYRDLRRGHGRIDAVFALEQLVCERT